MRTWSPIDDIDHFSVEDCIDHMRHLFEGVGASSHILHDLDLVTKGVEDALGITEARERQIEADKRFVRSSQQATFNLAARSEYRAEAETLEAQSQAQEGLADLREDVAVEFPSFEMTKDFARKRWRRPSKWIPSATLFDILWKNKGDSISLTTEDGARLKEGCALEDVVWYINESIQSNFKLADREYLFMRLKQSVESSFMSDRFSDFDELVKIKRVIDSAIKDFNTIRRSTYDFIDRIEVPYVELNRMHASRSEEVVFRGVKKMYSDL